MRMKALITIPMAFLASVAGAQLKDVNAGLIAYSCLKERAHYLLAYDPDNDRRAWGALGGEPVTGESAEQTARREFREETNCAYDKEAIDQLVLVGPSNFSGFYSFVARVAHQPPELIARSRECQAVERSFWVWVPHDSLIDSLKRSESDLSVRFGRKPSVKLHLWGGAAASLKRALLDDALAGPGDPCRRADK